MDCHQPQFMTQKGYGQKNNSVITPSMEDYLEMIYRQYKNGIQARINTLAKELNVKASSASKMIINLKTAGLIDYEKYGVIYITPKGIETGEYLLHRHDVLNAFFSLINKTPCETEQIEQIEHFITKETILNMEKLIPFLQDHNLNYP